MLSSRRRSPVRFVIALLLALLVSVRGGGLALACDLASIEKASAESMANHDMPTQRDGTQHSQHGNESCDSPDRVQCAAMAACAPAIAATVDDDVRLEAERSITAAIADVPDLVDRSPDPPPPRA